LRAARVGHHSFSAHSRPANRDGQKQVTTLAKSRDRKPHQNGLLHRGPSALVRAAARSEVWRVQLSISSGDRQEDKNARALVGKAATRKTRREALSAAAGVTLSPPHVSPGRGLARSQDRQAQGPQSGSSAGGGLRAAGWLAAGWPAGLVSSVAIAPSPSHLLRRASAPPCSGCGSLAPDSTSPRDRCSPGLPPLFEAANRIALFPVSGPGTGDRDRFWRWQTSALLAFCLLLPCFCLNASRPRSQQSSWNCEIGCRARLTAPHLPRGKKWPL